MSKHRRQHAESDEFFILRSEIDYLKGKLECVGPDLLDAMRRALDPDASMGSLGGAGGSRQQRSRPPYAMHIEALIDELGNELTTVVRDICETRNLAYDGAPNPEALATWLVAHRYALAMMPQAPDLFEGLVKVIDRCLRSVNQLEPEYQVTQSRVEAANRQVVTGPQVEKLARQLGDEGKGLTERRVKYLRNKGFLSGTQDSETGTWFYRFGDVLSAQRRAKATRMHHRVGA